MQAIFKLYPHLKKIYDILLPEEQARYIKFIQYYFTVTKQTQPYEIQGTSFQNRYS